MPDFSEPTGRINSAAKKLGPKLSTTFRRTFATILSNCYDLSAQTVQDRIGDRDMKTTSRYLGKVKNPSA